MNRLLLLSILTFLGVLVYAQPTTITWQGKLLDNNGNAITQSNVAMTFAMFDAATGGNQLWPASGVVTKTVDVVNGLYSVQLGTGTGDDIAFTAAMFDGLTPWLEVKVGTETIPRTEITTVPFALISNSLSATGWESPGELGKTNPNTGNFTSLETENVKITAGAGEGKVLTSDADGNASWGTFTGTETDPVFSESPAAQVSETDITNLSNLSGINTGDQDLSNLATKTALGDSVEQLRSEIPDVSRFITSETDPVFLNSVAYGITQSDTSRWNNKFWKKFGNDIYYPDGKVGIGISDPATLNTAPFNVEGGIRYAGGLEGTGVPGQLYYDPADTGTFRYVDNLGRHKVFGAGSINYSGTLWNLQQSDLYTYNDVICGYSLGVGYDVSPGESFGFTTVLLKENNLRIKFDDTSVTSGFPANDWQLTANESISGGVNYFAIEDLTGATVPFKVLAGAPTNSLVVSPLGNLGLKSGNPATQLHIRDSITPTIRFEQVGVGENTPQTWDIGGNDTNFFIRDATGDSTLPFRIRTGAPENSIYVQNDGNIGIGTNLPARKIHVNGAMRMDPVTEPNNPAAGDVYFDSGIHKLRYHNGSGWQDLSTPPTLPPMWSYSNGDFFSNGRDVICNESLAIGYDAVPGESFGFATIILKENNLRIKFDDTSVTSGFPANDWQLTANESLSGGVNYFAIEDLTGATVPFKVLAGAPTNSLVVSGSGNTGFGIGTPARKIHINDALRLEPIDEPATAGEGDIYYDKNIHKLRCYDGTTWHDLW